MLLEDDYETSGDYVYRLLNKMKIRHLGSGAYATVFQHPTMKDVAVKFVKYEDEAYMRFARFALRNKTNPWLPRIYSIHKVKMQHDALNTAVPRYIIFLEKLEESALGKIRDAVQQIVAEIPDSIVDKWNHIPKTFVDFRRKHWELVQKYSKDKGLRQLAQFMVSSTGYGDLHSGNIMARPDGHLVVTDPVAP